MLKGRVILGSGEGADSPSILHSLQGKSLGGYGTYFNAPGHPICPKVLVKVLRVKQIRERRKGIGSLG